MSNISQEDADLNFYEGVRKQIVTKLTAKGIPSDLEEASLLLKAVDGGSKVALTKKRLSVDQETNATEQQRQEMIAAVLLNSPTAQQARKRTEALPVIEQSIPLPGETSIGTKEVRYNEMVQSNQ